MPSSPSESSSLEFSSSLSLLEDAPGDPGGDAGGGGDGGGDGGGVGGGEGGGGGRSVMSRFFGY